MSGADFVNTILKPIIKAFGDSAEEVVQTSTFQKILIPLSKIINDEVLATNIILTTLFSIVAFPISLLDVVFNKGIGDNIFKILYIFVALIILCFVFVFTMRINEKKTVKRKKSRKN
jgi:undecaprenyl pyrophosphate phosphatase UppP